MAAGASGIRAGRAYVEVGANDEPLQKKLKAIEARLSNFGGSMRSVGMKLAGLGAAMAAPLGLATKAFGGYEDAMASLRSAANPTAAELAKINAAVMDISKATGFGPTQVAEAMTELLKAGMSVEQVLDGAATAALQFAKVSGMDVAEAATVITDAMNVFGVDAKTAVDTLSKAADASSISVRDVAMSFSQASAVAKMAGLTITETANAIAILGQNGVKGSDAGTSLKTMMLRLLAPVDEGAKAIEELGINLRNADGSMKDMRGIIQELTDKLGGLGAEAKDEALRKIFGSDAIRAGTILLKDGVAGWDAFAAKMAEGLPVSEKFGMLMGTLSGTMQAAWAAVERLGVAVGQALAPAFAALGGIVSGTLDGLTQFVTENSGLVVGIGAAIAAVTGLGIALVALGTAVSAIAAGFGLLAATLGAIGAAVAFVMTPIGFLISETAAIGAVFLMVSGQGEAAMKAIGDAFGGLLATAQTTLAGIGDALKAGDFGLAMKIGMAGLNIEFTKAINALKLAWSDFLTFIADTTANVFSAEGALSPLAAIGGAHPALKAIKEANGGKINLDRERQVAEGQAEVAQRQAELDQLRAQAGQAASGGGEAGMDLGAIDSFAAGFSDALGTTVGPAMAQGIDDGMSDFWGAGFGDALTGPAAAELPTDIADAALGMSSRRTEVAGGFDAAALQGLGFGSTIENDQLSESKKQTRLMEEFNAHARRGQIVFTNTR